jgi:PIN domain nuclease of toxin-antitoxin system
MILPILFRQNCWRNFINESASGYACLFMVDFPDKLSDVARRIIEADNNELYLSVVSGWEIAIKTQINKLILPDVVDLYVENQIEENSIIVLPIEMKHALHVCKLPDIHRDPFDRMIISQGILEDLPILTNDGLIKKYPVETFW